MRARLVGRGLSSTMGGDSEVLRELSEDRECCTVSTSPRVVRIVARFMVVVAMRVLRLSETDEVDMGSESGWRTSGAGCGYNSDRV